MIVKADDVESPALKEMIIGVRLVAACCDGARGVVTAYDVAQITAEDRVDAHLLAMCEGRGVVAGIEYEVGLFGSKIIGISRRPLLEHLVAYAPHEDRGMVAVAEHEVGKVALSPLVEEACVVVLGLAASPHVERLVHDDQSHRVAHGEELRCGRVV